MDRKSDGLHAVTSYLRQQLRSILIGSSAYRGPLLKGGTRLDAFYTRLNQFAALLLLLAFSPLLIFIGWRIWREDGAPILFTQYRLGQHGKLYRCFKFRTMRLNADAVLAEHLANDPVARAQWQRNFKLYNDPRVTRLGRFLRKTSLDELPQLLNVLRGEMNLVGPRPLLVQELRRYGSYKCHYLTVKPGITGLWQVTGRSNTSFEQRAELDMQYIQARTLWLDARILGKTLLVVLAKDGAY